jgi:NSS family neurotransmitter:Na+ symporter
METNDITQRDSFTGRIGIIAAVAGSAVGLGNIWKFPYITGVYGGGAFVLVYLICIAIIRFRPRLFNMYRHNRFAGHAFRIHNWS